MAPFAATNCGSFQAFALYQGTTLVVPPTAKLVRALAPATVKSARNFQWKQCRGQSPIPLAPLYGTTEVVP